MIFVRRGSFARVTAIHETKTPRRRSRRLSRLSRFELTAIVTLVVVGVGLVLAVLILAAQTWK